MSTNICGESEKKSEETTNCVHKNIYFCEFEVWYEGILGELRVYYGRFRLDTLVNSLQMLLCCSLKEKEAHMVRFNPYPVSSLEEVMDVWYRVQSLSAMLVAVVLIVS